MATRLKIKNSNQGGKVPLASDLYPAELAINLVDRKLYSKNTTGDVFVINDDVDAGVMTVNGDAGPDVVLDADDVGALALGRIAGAGFISGLPDGWHFRGRDV